VGAADSPRCPLVDKFLHRAIVPANAYQCTKCQLASSISSGDIEGVPKYKLGAADLPRRPLADKFLYWALVLRNPTSVPNFNFLAPRNQEHRHSIQWKLAGNHAFRRWGPCPTHPTPWGVWARIWMPQATALAVPSCNILLHSIYGFILSTGLMLLSVRDMTTEPSTDSMV